MATHKSAEKRARQSERRRERNRNVRSRVRTLIKAFHTTLASGDVPAAQERLRSAEGAIRGAASKGIIPKRTASRTVSRLAKRLSSQAPA